jgi:putative DNA primase/helicase
MHQDSNPDYYSGSPGTIVHRKANGGNGAGGGNGELERNGSNKRDWLQPKPLPNGLAQVEAFSTRFTPEALGPWIDDISNRLQCPPDYVGVTAVTALGAVVGRRVGIRPQIKTDWMEVPNQWGCFIGRPGMLKSPAMNEALRPIRHLEAEAAKENEIAQQAYQAGMSAYKLRRDVKVALEKAQLKKTKQANADIDFQIGEEPREPMLVRYRTNDTSYESLGELLISNPAGILVERDELISLLRHLDRDDQSVARGFFLSGWSGAQPYTFDRIVRGHRHIDAVCISLIGNTQPARISEYVRRASLGGAGGDGLIQRFGLMVWPGASPDWRNVDEYPDNVARQRAWKVYERASKLDVVAALALGASKGPYNHVPFFRFDEEAHDIFLDWRADLERRLRSGEESPALEGHLAKYRKLVPTLALLNHIANNDQTGAFHRNHLFERLRSQSISRAMQEGYTGPARRVNSRQRKQF